MVVGASETTAEANFKLVQTWGKLETSVPIKDEVFGLEVTNALRLSRKVEMFQFCKKTKDEDFDGSDSEEKEDQMVDANYMLKFSRVPVANDPADVLRQNPARFPVTSTHKIVPKASLKNFELTQDQCARLGRFQTMRITDEVRDVMINRIQRRKEFQDYKQFFRYKNYLICRLESPEALDNEFGFTNIKERKTMKYRFGDLRILFEVVPCAKVSLCGQQIQPMGGG